MTEAILVWKHLLFEIVAQKNNYISYGKCIITFLWYSVLYIVCMSVTRILEISSIKRKEKENHPQYYLFGFSAMVFFSLQRTCYSAMNLSFLTWEENISCLLFVLQSETHLMIIASNDMSFTSTHTQMPAEFSSSHSNTFEASQKS